MIHPTSPRREPDPTYEYREEDGKLLYYVERFPTPDGGKRFVQRAADGTPSLNGVRRVPYRLPELLEARARGDGMLIVVEGEKDAERLRAELDAMRARYDDVAVTTNAGGAAVTWPDDWLTFFGADDVSDHGGFAMAFVLGDNDDAGRKAAQERAAFLARVIPDVRVHTFDDLSERADVSDFLDLGFSVADLFERWERAPMMGGEVSEARSEEALALGPDDDDGSALFDAVAEFIARYVACEKAARVAAVLWVAHTHALEAFDVSPRLSICSKEPGSGKTRFLEVLKPLVRAPLFMANVSESYLFRRVDAEPCTILHDEIDAVFGPKARDREDLRALLNAGWERGAVVGRMIGDGSNLKAHDFKVFAPVALAGLGRLPDTLDQRSITLTLKRRKPDDPVAKFRRREVGPEAEKLRNRLKSWCGHRERDGLERARPAMPDQLGDRAQDAWEPLLAIADAAGGDWPRVARDAAIELDAARQSDSATIGVRLLADIRDVFDNADVPKVSDPEKGDALKSGDLASALAAIEGSPWAEWGRDDKPLTANALARMLRGYDVKPDQHKMAGENMRGYLRSDFDDAWTRYLKPVGDDSTDPSAESVADADVLPANPNNAKGGNTSTRVTLLGSGKGNARDDGTPTPLAGSGTEPNVVPPNASTGKASTTITPVPLLREGQAGENDHDTDHAVRITDDGEGGPW